MYTEIRIRVSLPIPEGTPRHEHNWPKFKKTFLTLGEENIKRLRTHIEETYPEALEVNETLSESSMPVIYLNTCGESAAWNPELLFMRSLGDIKTSRGEYQNTVYGCEEFIIEGMAFMNEKIAEQNKNMDGYYSQRWV